MTSQHHLHALAASAFNQSATSTRRVIALALLLLGGWFAPLHDAQAITAFCNMQNRSASPVTVAPNGTVTVSYDVADQGNCASDGPMGYSISVSAGGTLQSPAPTGMAPVGTNFIQVLAGGTPGSFTITVSCTANCSTTNTFSWTVNIQVPPDADLSIAIADAPDPVDPAGSITYTISAGNAGPDIATSAVWSTTLPPELVFTSISAPAGWTCVDPGVGNNGSINCTNASFGVTTADDVFTLVTAVTGSPAGGTIITTAASISSSVGDSNAANDNASTTTTVANSADLHTTISDSPDPVVQGADITYTITANNGGPDGATSVSLDFEVPANTTMSSLTPAAGWSCTDPGAGNTGPVNCTIASLAASASDSFTLVVTVGIAVPPGTIITNNVNIGGAETDPDPADNDSFADTTVAAIPTAALSINITDTPDPVTAGGQITYTLDAFYSSGPDLDTTVDFVLPANTTFASVNPEAGWSCTTPSVGGTGTVSCNNPGMAGDNSDLIDVVLNVDVATPGGTIITATATVSSAVFDPDLSNNTSSTTTTVTAAPTANLNVSVTDSPDPVDAGSNITYTITVGNAGPDAAASATLSNATPANTTFTSLTSPAGWSCTTPAVGATGTVNCSNAGVPASASDVFTLVVNVDAGTAGGTVITDTANVSSSTFDNDSSDNSASTTTTVATPPSADLSVGVTDSPDPVDAGSNITYTITVGNSGPDAAASATLTDIVPTNTTFVSLASPAGWSCTTPAVGATGTVSCSNPGVAASASDVFTLVVNVDTGTPGGTVITDTATVATATADPTPGNDTATTTTTVATPPSADLSVGVTDSPDPVDAGSNITYTITVGNAGPDAAASATLTDIVPTNTTFVSLASPAGWSCTTPAVGATGTVSCSNPGVAASASDVITLVVNVDTGTPGGTVITDTATVATATADPTPGNDTASTTTTVATPPSADLSVGVTDSPDPVDAGSNITYTITVGNAGPDAAASATLSNAIPANTTFTSLTSPAGWSCTTPAVGATGTVSCSNPSVAASASDVFTLVVNVDAGTSGGTVITDTATVASATADPTPGNDTATTTTTVATPPSADLSVGVTDSPDPVDAGSNITYTITVGNAGPDAAASATLTDIVPTNTTFVSLASPAGWSCTTPAVGATGTVSCSNPGVAASASDVFTLVVNVDTGTPGGTVITDTATVATATADPTPGNDTASTTTTVATPPSADLSVGVTDSPDPVDAGSNITYTITVGNAGPDAAASATLSNAIPANTTFTSLTSPAGWSCTTPAVGATGTVSCSNPSVAASASDVFTLVVNVDAGTSGGTVITDTATVASATADPTPGNDTATTTTTVATPPSADLSVGVTDSPDPVDAGSNITYTITVGNAGPDAAASATLTDAIPANTTFVSLASPAGWSCTTPAVGGTGTVNCGNPSFAASATDVFTLVVNVDTGTPGGTVITDSANVSSSTFDSNSGNGTATTTTTVATPLSADLAVSVSDSPDPVDAGANLTYTVTVGNAGPDAAASATLTDAVPANTTFVSLASPAGWSCTTPAVGATGTVSCSNPSVAASASDVFTLVVNVDTGTPGGTVITDTATVGTATADPTPGNDTASTTTTVATPSAELSVSVTDTPDPVNAGANLSYTITVVNNGPDAAASATLTDVIPANTTFASLASPIGWLCSTPAVGGTGTVTCSKPSVLASATNVFTLVVTVDAATPGGTVITDTATIASSTADPIPANNAATTTTTVATPLSADLGVTIADAPDPVAAGSNITYTITVGNAGPDAAASATLNVPVPAFTTFASFGAAAGWSCTTPSVGGTGPVDCSNPSVAASANDVFTFVVTVDPAAPGGTVITDSAGVASATADPDTSNDLATTTTTVATPLSADIGVALTDAPDPVAAGATITYSLTVTNAGPDAAANATLSDAIPANTTFASLAHPGTWSCSAPAVGATGSIFCSNPSLAASASDVFTVVVTVDPATAGGTVITNTASVGTTTADPAPANDSATTTTLVASNPALSITKTFDSFLDNDVNSLITEGDTLEYTVTATNTGDVPLTGVTISDPQLTPNSASCLALALPGDTCVLFGTHVVTPGDVAAGSVTNTATADSAETAPVTASVTVTITPNPTLSITSGNNQSGLTSTIADAPLVVTLLDGQGNPLANTTVTWTATGAGSVAPTTTTTNASGQAQVQLTFGPNAGGVTVIATASTAGNPSVTFNATAENAVIGIASGDGQTAPINTTLPLPLVVQVNEPVPFAKAGGVTGQALDGVPVTFTVTSGGGTTAPVTVLTDASGQAQTSWTLGPLVGVQTVTASVSGGDSVTFSATATLARTLTIVSGNGQSAAPGSQLPNPLVVHAEDNGADAPAVGINWIVTGNATAAPASPTTDANGLAQATVTIGAAGGAVSIRAERADDPSVFVTFTASTARLQLIPGLTPEEQQLAVIIDEACDALTAQSSLTPPQQDFLERCRELIDASIIDPGAVTDALDALLPGLALVMSEASLNAAQAQFQNLKARIAALRSGTQGSSFQGLALVGPGGSVSLGALGQALTQDEGTATQPTGEVGGGFQRWGFFASGTIGRGEAEAGSTRPAYDYDINGLTAGLDYRYNDRFIFGGALGYTRQDTELQGAPGEMEMSGWSVSGYATYYRDNSWYTDGVLTWGRNSFDLLRTITYTVPTPGGGSSTVSQTARSQSDGDMLEAAFTFGRDFQAGGWSIGPYGRLLYTKLDFDEVHDEMDPGTGSGLGLSIDARSVTSVASEIGAKFTYAHSTDWGVVTPHLQVEWEHEFKDDPKAITARFLADPTGTPFTLSGEEVDTDYFRMSVGLSIIMTKGRSGFLIYERTLGRNGFDQDNLGFGLRIEF